MNNKKGVSTIVTVVLLILVSITAVALIAAFVVPFIKGSLSQSNECYATLGKVDVVAGSNTCFDATTNTVRVNIKKGFVEGSEIKAVAVVLSGDGKSKRYDVSNGGMSANIRELSGSYNTALSLPADGESNTYVFNVTDAGMTVVYAEVSPILSSDKVCEAAKAEIPTCA
ncbi:MAG: hypothetical protein AABW73_02145 [Nanoarchaeota archaeon]